MATVIVKWLNKGVHFGREDSVKRRFILDEGELKTAENSDSIHTNI